MAVILYLEGLSLLACSRTQSASQSFKQDMLIRVFSLPWPDLRWLDEKFSSHTYKAAFTDTSIHSVPVEYHTQAYKANLMPLPLLTYSTHTYTHISYLVLEGQHHYLVQTCVESHLHAMDAATSLHRSH